MTQDRRNRILTGIDIASARGMEIGPLAWPVVHKYEGDITYVDHATTDELRKKYADVPGVPEDLIVPVDAVWGAQTLAEAVQGRRFDYIVASHVVEHVPDLIDWFKELADVLTPNGEIRLVVPDRRYTFDHHRHDTLLADVLTAHAVRARVPQPQQVLSFATHLAPIEVAEAWDGKCGTPPERTPEAAQQWLEHAREAMRGTYQDVHCWVFTPHSWARLMMDLDQCGLMSLKCAMWEDTQPRSFEFLVGLRAGSGGWDQMARDASEDSRGARLRAEMLRLHMEIERGRTERAALQDEIGHARNLETLLRTEIAALRQSTSWRITAPLRWMVERVRDQ